MVSAAASVQDAMREAAAVSKISVVFNFGASGMLAQQIQQGAPADIFLSAASKPMDTLSAAGLLVEDTRRNLLRNQIVLIAPRDRGPRAFSDLGSAKLIAMGEPASVPPANTAARFLPRWDYGNACRPGWYLQKMCAMSLPMSKTAMPMRALCTPPMSRRRCE